MEMTKSAYLNGISSEEKDLSRKSIGMALGHGASAVQVTLDKAVTYICALLNGEIDNIRQTGDRSLTFRIFADGRYGVFSTNRFDEKDLDNFLRQAVENVSLLAPDPYRKLPPASSYASDSVRGDETGLCYEGYDSVKEEQKIEAARRVSLFTDQTRNHGDGWKVVSEEVEFNNTFTDTLMLDSQGLDCRQTETSFEICSNITIEDSEGRKYNGFWWDYGIGPDKVMRSDCGEKALKMACMQIGAEETQSGHYTMAVSRTVSSRLLKPILSALGGRSIQQHSSFLDGTLGKKIFSPGMTLTDLPRVKGKCGAILFEPDGRATKDREIITGGVIREYFISTYISGKTGMPATSDCANRPVLKPYYISDTDSSPSYGSIGEEEILKLCREGIFVTGFNGGNCNNATGDFSYGVEGFLIKDGKLGQPITGMLITGNMTELWNNLIACGDDPMDGMSVQTGTLAFRNVTFSA